jgi:hypothetical protein
MPAYDPSSFDDSAYSVVEDINAATMFPTYNPTLMPTIEDFVITTEDQEFSVLVTAFLFPISAAEATNPVLRKSLRQGVASAVGVLVSAVTIKNIDGVSFDRRLSEGLNVAFEIRSPSNEATDQLIEYIEDAATSGAIVANVKSAANEAGVLTQSLKAMPLVLPKPDVQPTTQIMAVVVQRQPTADPATSPTTFPTDYRIPSTAQASGASGAGATELGSAPSGGDKDDTTVIGASAGGAGAVVLILALVYCFTCKGRKKNEPVDKAPVDVSSLEQALEVIPGDTLTMKTPAAAAATTSDAVAKSPNETPMAQEVNDNTDDGQDMQVVSFFPFVPASISLLY